jgi:trigger factor
MNITLKNSDPVNATITIAVEKEDYRPQVQKALSDIRKNIVLDGFRKGYAPISRIQALYGKSVLVDEMNKLVSEKLQDYIKENHLNVLGEPLPSETEQTSLDLDNQEKYEFVFDVALAPEMNVGLTKSDKITYYNILVADEMIEKQIQNFKASYGRYESVAAAGEKDMIKGLLVELDAGATGKENGIRNEEATLLPFYMKDEAEKAKFINAKPEDTIIFNPYKAYDGHEAELSSFLKTGKDDVANHQGDCSFLVKEITGYKEAELNRELFDKIYAPGTVTSEAEFRDKIKESVASDLAPESDYKFLIDAKQLLEKKAKNVKFPDAFLKRWLLETDSKMTKESIEEDYPAILDSIKFQLIKNKIVEDNKIQVEFEEIRQKALDITRKQFERYGMSNISESVLEEQTDKVLKREESIRNIYEKLMEEKLTGILKSQVTLKPKAIAFEAFQKLLEEQK